MHQVSIGSRNYSIASNWNEVSEIPARAIGPYLAYDTRPNRLTIICLLSGKRRQMGADLMKASRECAGWLPSVLDTVSWVWERRPVAATDVLKPIVQGMTWKKTNWLLPKPDLADVTLGEWAYIEAWLMHMERGDDPAAAVKLFFTICRPERPARERLANDFDGYPRRHFNPQIIERQAEEINRIPAILLRAAVDYASRAREWLPLRYPRLYTRDKAALKSQSFGTLGLILSLADGGAFGTKADVEQVNIHEAFIYLTKNLMDAEKREARSNPNTTVIR